MSIEPLITMFLSFSCVINSNGQVSTQAAPPPVHLSRHQLHVLIGSAHSTAQYEQLASYYRAKEADYRAKAAAEKVERDRRAQVNAPLYEKYPRPVDSAQRLYQSYLADADQAAANAKHYEQLAAQDPPASPL
jgi:hypothetical protein